MYDLWERFLQQQARCSQEVPMPFLSYLVASKSFTIYKGQDSFGPICTELVERAT